MKIVRLVLLLSAISATAACQGNAVTDPRDVVSAPTVLSENSSSDTTTTRDGGHSMGSGT